MINFKNPVTTRESHKIKFYEAYQDFIHGAWYEDERDMWMMATWTLPNGFHLTDSRLDLVEGEPYEPENWED